MPQSLERGMAGPLSKLFQVQNLAGGTMCRNRETAGMAGPDAKNRGLRGVV